MVLADLNALIDHFGQVIDVFQFFDICLEMFPDFVDSWQVDRI